MFNSKPYDPNTAVYYDPKKDHKVAVVTGGTQGIGFFTILHLYLHGFTVYLLGRNEEKSLKSIESIKKTASERVAGTEAKPGSITYVHCDLLQLSTVKSAAESVKAKEKHVDVLINNAGLLGVPYELSKDGVEVQYQVNTTAHALLTLELVPVLEKAAEPRVVFVSSLVHYFVLPYRNPGDEVDGTPKIHYALQRYGLGKLGQIHFVKEATKQFPKIQFTAVHPGVIHTELYSEFYKSLSWLSGIFQSVYKLSTSFMTVTEEGGSASSLKAALDPAHTASGSYLTTGGAGATPSRLARKDAHIKTSWDWNIAKLKDNGYTFDYVK